MSTSTEQPRPWQERREMYLSQKEARRPAPAQPSADKPQSSTIAYSYPYRDVFSVEQRVEIVRHLLTLSRRGKLAGVLYCDAFILRLAALDPIGPKHFRRLSWFSAYCLIKEHPELCPLSFKILDRKPR